MPSPAHNGNGNGDGNTSSSANPNNDPHAVSAELRAALRDQMGAVFAVSNFFPIERYYEAAEKTYQGFQQAYNLKDAHKSYLYGKRYCHFCVDAIPKHQYFKHCQAKKDKATLAIHQKVVQVMDQLEQVVVWLDRIETERLVAEQKERERQQKLYLQHCQQQAKLLEQREAQRLADIKRRAASMRPSSSSSSSNLGSNNNSSNHDAVQVTAMQKLKLLQAQQSAASLMSSSEASLRIPKDPSGERRSTTRFRLDSDDSDDNRLPPPLAPPSSLPPPSYSDLVSSSIQPPPLPNDGFLNGAKFQLDGDGHPISSSPSSKSTITTTKKKPLRILREEYRQAYLRLQKQGRIDVQPLRTYQGRMVGSTNGCTVISALVAGHHLRQGSKGITNDGIAQIIDQDCIPVLKAIRSKLGLGAHALIIPSDVHDYLVDRKLLKQEAFSGVAGGNVMDPEHLGELIRLLEGSHPQNPTAATFFFKEHVISLCKTVGTGGGGSSSSSSNGSAAPRYHLIDSLPSTEGGNGASRGTRTTCHDIESLRTLLHWYCSRKLSDVDRLDKTPWDESLADFDPRVFQGFCWEEGVVANNNNDHSNGTSSNNRSQ